MAAELFSTFADFKAFVGGRVNNSLELDSIAPTIYETARRHIVPYLGSLYDTLVAGSGLTTAQTNLLPYVRRPLALLTMYEYSKVGGMEVSDSGFHRVETDTRKASFRYQEKMYQEDMREKGYEALETMLIYLTANKADHADWAASDEGLAHLNPLLNYARDFRMLTNVQCDRYTFDTLKAIISSIELFGVEKLLPASFWAAYLVKYKAGTLSTAEKQLLKYVRTAIAHRSLQEAISQQWVRVQAGRVYAIEEFGEQSQYNRTEPQATVAGLTMSNRVWSDRYTQMWKEYIAANVYEFPLVFDEDSGGTNATDDDAWHVNTTDEQSTANIATDQRKSGAAFQL